MAEKFWAGIGTRLERHVRYVGRILKYGCCSIPTEAKHANYYYIIINFFFNMSNYSSILIMIYWMMDMMHISLTFFLYYVKWINFMLLCICSGIDQRWCQKCGKNISVIISSWQKTFELELEPDLKNIMYDI